MMFMLGRHDMESGLTFCCVTGLQEVPVDGITLCVLLGRHGEAAHQKQLRG